MTIVTGKTSSRLIELEKYVRSDELNKRYFTGGTLSSDGIDALISSANTLVVYYIGGIEYTDNYNDSGKFVDSEFRFTITNATADNQQTNFPIIKDFEKGDVVARPEVKSDVFIERQSLSVFEQQYRLKVVRNLSELNFYAGGGNFNIIDNT